MEHFINNSDDHNSSFFQPPKQDDESDVVANQPNPSESQMDTTTTTAVQPIRRSKLNFDEEANIKLQVLVSNFSDEQLDRYEMYRRSAFSKVAIKRLMHSITGAVPSSSVVIAMAGIAKVFVGELVEEALEIQRREKNNPEIKTTALEPKHIREANRRINSQHHCPQRKTWKSKRKSRF